MENLRLQIINTLITLLKPLEASYKEVTDIINDLSFNKTESLMNFINTYYGTIPYNAKVMELATTLTNQGLLKNEIKELESSNNAPATNVETTIETKEVTNDSLNPVQESTPINPVETNTKTYKLITNRPLNVKNNDFLNIQTNTKEKFKDIPFSQIDDMNCYLIDTLPLVKPQEEEPKEEIMEIQPTETEDTSNPQNVEEEMPSEFNMTLTTEPIDNSISKVLEVTPSNGIPIAGNALNIETPSVPDMEDTPNETKEVEPKVEFEPFEVTSLHSLSKLNANIDNQVDNNLNNPNDNDMTFKDTNFKENPPIEEEYKEPESVPLDVQPYNFSEEEKTINQIFEEAKNSRDKEEIEATINELEEEKRKLEEEKERLKELNLEKERELERQKEKDLENDKIIEEERKRKEREHAEELARRDEILRKKILDAQLSYIDNASKFIKDLETKSEPEIYESLYNLYRIDYIYHCLSNSSTETLNRFLNYLNNRMNNEKAYISIYMEQAIKKVLGTRAYQEENKKIA